MEMIAAARWLAAKPMLVDGTIAVALTVMAQVQAGWAVSTVDRGLLFVATGVVAWRRRAPLTTSLVVAGAVGLMAVTAQQPSVFGEYLAFILAAYTVAERRGIWVATLGGMAMVAGVVVHDLASPDYNSAGAIAGDLIVPILIWGLGRIVNFQYWRADRSQVLLEQLEQDQADLARRAVVAERAHLARELHDVVTHSVSVVVIQAQGAQRVLDGDQPEVRQSLADIESAGRTALTEMRRLLGLLRDEEREQAPQPGLADLPQLITRIRAAGLVVQLSETGTRHALAQGVELSIYRIVQEALTNALKHAPRSLVTVELEHVADRIEVRITDNGPSVGTDRDGGRGLVGMHERVSLYGGMLEAGPLPDGGFHLHARLPIKDVTS